MKNEKDKQKQKKSQRLNGLKRNTHTHTHTHDKKKRKVVHQWQRKLKARTQGGAETTAPKIPCGASSPGVSLLGNPGKQDGDLRERSPVAEALRSPGRREQFTNWSPVETAALRKGTSVLLVSFFHGAETEKYFPQSLLLPTPAARSLLSRVGRGRRPRRQGRGRGRGRGQSGVRGVFRVRNAEF